MSSVPEPEPAWLPTKALGRAILLTGVVLLVAVLFGRFDLVVLVAPVALGAAVGLARRPAEAPAVELSTDDQVVVEGSTVEVSVGVANPGGIGYDLMLVRLRTPIWVRISGGDRPYVAGTSRRAVVDVELTGEARRWGRHPVGPVTAHAVAGDGLLISVAVATDPLLLNVYPQVEPFKAAEVMPRAAGLVGAHRSRRPGEGGELAGVRPFGPGDRLRRIDWRVSLRTRQLHVAATLSDRDAEVLLLLDVLHEAGRSGGVGGAASVLDTTVRSAAAIAEHYLTRGDRVALLEYGFRSRWLRPGSGRRHYLTALQWLLDVAPTDTPYEPTSGAFGTTLIPSHALVIVFTPLLDTRTVAMLARMARSGRVAIAVDTLGSTEIRLSAGTHWLPVAQRLWMLERANLVGQLREHGVPVVSWAGAGSLDSVLRDVSQLAAAPKARAR